MCFRNRKTGAVIVTIVASLVVILSAALMIETVVFQSSTSFLNSDFSNFKEPKEFSTKTFYTLIFASIFTVLLGCFGLCCLCRPCVRSRAWTVIYGLTLMLVLLIFLVFGFLTLVISTNGPETLQAYCDG